MENIFENEQLCFDLKVEFGLESTILNGQSAGLLREAGHKVTLSLESGLLGGLDLDRVEWLS